MKQQLNQYQFRIKIEPIKCHFGSMIIYFANPKSGKELTGKHKSTEEPLKLTHCVYLGIGLGLRVIR